MLRRLSIFGSCNAIVVRYYRTDVQHNSNDEICQDFGSVHAKQFELPEGVYRARLRVGDNSGDYGTSGKDSKLQVKRKKLTYLLTDKYSSYPATSRIIDPSKSGI